ncbi:shikimate dehydrogenase family protein, partial [Candidatus Omnitrophota bacterium]
MENDNDTKKTYGLLGRNISYSLSPTMHNAAFRHFGISAEYKLFDVEESKIDDFFNEFLNGKISGFNVTVPYKIKVHDMLWDRDDSRLTAEIERLGTVNTVVLEESGMPHGYN